MKTKSYRVSALILALLVTPILLLGLNVLTSIALTHEMYWKADFADFAPSGMTDFDQRQPGWDNPLGSQVWTWCAPVAVANSLWWMDSRHETSTTPPPTVNDTFLLVSNYTTSIDDHDPTNVVPFTKHLAYLMDTDGIRTGTPHKGTNVFDTQAGIAQHLSWTGLNPLGDANGDGIVDVNDETIVMNAMGAVPGMATWNLAADIWPETVTGPYTADNSVDNNDLNLVTANMNKTGMFYEQIVQAPDFYFIDEKVERSEAVILVLGFYYNGFRDEDLYTYGSGHFVTVAGINSTAMQIAISDPIQDNAEPPPQGKSGPGRVLPSIHPHGLGPIYPLHNNASYVSQDIYNVTWSPPGVPANFTLKNYTSTQYLGLPPPIAAVEWGIIVSPLDTIPPTISMFSPENKTYTVEDVPLTFTVSEPTIWIGYSLDGQNNVTLSGNTTIASLSEGVHTITVFANDTAGNTGYSGTIYFTVDTLYPSIEILSPEHKTYTSSSVPLTFTIDEATSWMSYSLEGQTNVTITGNTTLTGLSDRLHSLVVYASDVAGNTGSSDIVYFTTDTVSPSILILSPENKTYDTTEIPLTFTVDEQVSWMAYSLDGQANLTITGNTTLSGLSEGSHRIIVYAKDTAGNTGASQTTYFTIETEKAEPLPTWILGAIAGIAVIGIALGTFFLRRRKSVKS